MVSHPKPFISHLCKHIIPIVIRESQSPSKFELQEKPTSCSSYYTLASSTVFSLLLEVCKALWIESYKCTDFLFCQPLLNLFHVHIPKKQNLKNASGTSQPLSAVAAWVVAVIFLGRCGSVYDVGYYVAYRIGCYQDIV